MPASVVAAALRPSMPRPARPLRAERRNGYAFSFHLRSGGAAAAITGVDASGEVKIKTQRDSFEIKVAPEALRQIKKGDNVTLDLTITPLGAPSASPATR